MPAAVPRAPLTKPLLARFILEGGATTFCLILLGWLLLWMWWRVPKEQRVSAFQVAADWAQDEVPYQQNDIRALSGQGDAAEIADSELPNAVKAATTGEGGAAVVYVSWPVRVESPGDEPAALPRQLKKILQDSRRNLLLAIDFSQIDSDRGLGVYGNAPALTLPQELKDVFSNRSVFVLCSSRPGQKSWMIDGRGRSAFAYFLELGLKRPETRLGRATAEDLARYVEWNVSQWVKIHREAEQTPWRLPQSKSFKLPVFAFETTKAEPTATEVVEPRPTPKPDVKTAAAKSEATTEEPPAAKAVDPKIALRDDLMEEWKAYLKRKNDAKVRPYRYAPVSWRKYEFALLRAERLVRWAQNDASAVEAARTHLGLAAQARKNVDAAVKEQLDKENKLYFQAVRFERGDPGAKALNEAFKYLTTRDEIKLNQFLIPDAKPAPEAGKKAAIEPEKDEKEPPDELLAARSESWTAPHLELQLAAWADRFQATFKAPIFRTGARGGRLRDAIMARIAAEQALEVDRRGLEWIKRFVVDGDTIRRDVQDALFDPSDAVLNDLPAQIARYGQIYQGALKNAGVYRGARDLLEQMAAELPYYAEWMVLHAAAEPSTESSVEDGLPDPVEFAFKAAEALVAALEKGQDKRAEADPFRALKEAAENADAALQALKEPFDKVCAEPGNAAASWARLDAVLRTPLIDDPALRQRLLERAVQAEEPNGVEPPALAARAAVEPTLEPDPGFLRRAEGLARVEGYVIGLASAIKNKSLKFDSDLAVLLDDRSAHGNERLAVFERVGERLEKIEPWKKLGRGPRARDDAARSGALVDSQRASKLRDDDLAARWLSSGDLQATDDARAGDLFAFARRETLRFQAERLSEDFVRDVSLVVARAEEEYPLARSDLKTPKPAFLQAEAAPLVVEIDKQRRSGAFTANLSAQTEGGGPGEEAKLPAGSALIAVLPREPRAAADPAVAALPKQEPVRLAIAVARNEPPKNNTARLAGKLVKVGGPDDEKVPFLVTQLNSEERGKSGTKKLDIDYFYRGRVGADDEEAHVKVVTVDVHTQDFGEEVTVEIRQDPQELKLRFGEFVVFQDEVYELDQFRLHPGRAFLHQNRDLPYWLIVKNHNPTETKRLVVTRTLSGGNAPPTVDAIALKPGEREILRDRFRSKDLPLGEFRRFEIKVTDVNQKDVVTPLVVNVKQQKLEDYIQIDQKQGRGPVQGLPAPGGRFNVIFYRDAEDMNTDPILYRDIKINQNGERGLPPIFPNKAFQRGEQLTYGTIIQPNDTKIESTITIEDTTKKLESPVQYSLRP